MEAGSWLHHVPFKPSFAQICLQIEEKSSYKKKKYYGTLAARVNPILVCRWLGAHTKLYIIARLKLVLRS
jgi:hypothetical protein